MSVTVNPSQWLGILDVVREKGLPTVLFFSRVHDDIGTATTVDEAANNLEAYARVFVPLFLADTDYGDRFCDRARFTELVWFSMVVRHLLYAVLRMF